MIRELELWAAGPPVRAGVLEIEFNHVANDLINHAQEKTPIVTVDPSLEEPPGW